MVSDTKKFYACIIWNVTRDKENAFRRALSRFREFEEVFAICMKLPKDNASKVLYRMYDHHVERPWEKQIAALAGGTYLVSIVCSQDALPDQWIVTRGGVTTGNPRLTEFKEQYRACQHDSWLSLHTSINQSEARRDIYTHLGLCLEDLLSPIVAWPSDLAPATPGHYKDQHDFHRAIKSYSRCCLLGSTADLFMREASGQHCPAHYSLLVDDPKNARNFFGIEGGAVLIAGKQQSVSLVGIHSDALPPVWASAILRSRLPDRYSGLPVPSREHHFFSMAHFVINSQKGLTHDSASYLLSVAKRERLFSVNVPPDNRVEFVRRILRRFIVSSCF